MQIKTTPILQANTDWSKRALECFCISAAVIMAAPRKTVPADTAIARCSDCSVLAR